MAKREGGDYVYARVGDGRKKRGRVSCEVVAARLEQGRPKLVAWAKQKIETKLRNAGAETVEEVRLHMEHRWPDEYLLPDAAELVDDSADSTLTEQALEAAVHQLKVVLNEPQWLQSQKLRAVHPYKHPYELCVGLYLEWPRADYTEECVRLLAEVEAAEKAGLPSCLLNCVELRLVAELERLLVAKWGARARWFHLDNERVLVSWVVPSV